MKKSELRQIIKEEISKMLKTESKKQDIQSVKGDELEKYQKKYPGKIFVFSNLKILA